WTQLVNGEKDFELEFRFLTPRGEEHWVFGRAIPMRSNTGEVVGYVGVNEDITQRKLAEQQIRQQAALIDIASDAIFVRDFKENRIVFWSKGAAQLYGWSAEEAIGKVAHDLFNKSRAEIQDALNMAIKQGSWQGELTQRTKSGDNILVASRWTLIEDEQGKPQSLLTVNTDITDKKQLEAQFYQTQRLESLGRLAGGIAHDLGNVLTPILGVAQLLRITQAGADSSTQEHLEILENSAKRGAKMVKQILTFAQGSSEEKTMVDVDVLLQEVIDVARQGFPNTIEIRQANRQTSSSLAGGSLAGDARQRTKQVFADSTHLHQVFMNLCINARDAMPKGGVLTLSVEHCLIDEALANKNLEASVGEYVVVAVGDTGMGIPPEIRDRIFDPFFTTKGPDKGTGLGLATVSGIIKKIGGFLTVESEVDRGTQLKVYLPAIVPEGR
ncbi:MAG: PAS domain S-box protein, partial [Cyanobacteria bacterium J06555_13]